MIFRRGLKFIEEEEKKDHEERILILPVEKAVDLDASLSHFHERCVMSVHGLH